MKHTVVSVCIFAPLAVFGIWILSGRSSVEPALPPQAEPNSARVVVPAGTYLTLKVFESILQDSKPGETMQALTAAPVFADAQLAIPANTRAAFHIDSTRMRNSDLEDITVSLTQLIYTNQSVSIDASPLTITMQPMPALNLMMRSAGGMLGAAVGAAGKAVTEEAARLGAGTLEGLAAGTDLRTTGVEFVRFQVLKPIDVSGIRW